MTATCAEQEPTPSFTPFSNGQTITGIDFGNVANGDTSDAMDAFLKSLGTVEPTMLLYEDGDNGLFAGADGEGAEKVGYMVSMLEGMPPIAIYATEATEINGITFTKGYQNLTSGKYTLTNSITLNVENGVAEDTTLPWNGVLMGAVTGSTPPTPSTTFPQFYSGQTITGIDFGNVQNEDMSNDIDSFLSSLNYVNGEYPLVSTAQGRLIYAVDGTYFDTARGYGLICGGTVIYSTRANGHGGAVSIDAGFNNISNGKFMLSESKEVATVDATTASTWNGVLFGAVTE